MSAMPWAHSCRYAPIPSETNSTRPDGPDESYKELARRLSHLEAVVARLAGTAPESSPPEGLLFLVRVMFMS
ncbi:hypothetical protein PENNAL_c0007G08174 [Penicillium nalgiovense]|uniref:Uncharacterized protein n=1 Tax=Penicillium nalgiovense TaxID=60175 RepID=A0A1V6YYE3_PENNA|nr:hypothetical protein PENNAL_c0007G08174 [Penicillium nalgiovense]